MERPNKKPYAKLFLSTLTLSAFTFGGGFVIVSLMKKKFVDELHWIDDDDMLNLIAIAQASPGAIAVNGSILVGYRIAGFWGAVVSILGTILPPLVIISIISLFYAAFRTNEYVAAALKGMQTQRADIIVHGIAILFCCMEELRIEQITVSENGNLEGYLTMRYLL